MKKLFARSLNRLVAMAVFVILRLNVFFFCNENDWDFLHPVGVCDSIVFLEMNAFVNVIQY